MQERELATSLVALLEQLSAEQHAKLLACARELVPRLTEDDLKNPDDYPVLHRDPKFNYEDGVLAGLRVASAALRARVEEELR